MNVVDGTAPAPRSTAERTGDPFRDLGSSFMPFPVSSMA